MVKFKVLVSSDTTQFCECLSIIIEENDIFEVIGLCTGIKELVDKVARMRPDVVLWKVNESNPLPIVKALRSSCPFVIPVLLVDDPEPINLLELLRAGIRGCLPTRLLPRQIVRAMELITVAGILCIPKLGKEFSPCHPKIKGDGQDAIPSITEREHQILALVGKSYSNQEMARKLYLSESTVKTHLRNLFRKLGVRNRSEAVLLAVQKELINQNYSSYEKQTL